MDWIKNKLAYTSILVLSALSVIIVVSCKMTYGFTGQGSLDYSVTKTISIADFPITAEYVYAPLGVRFNEELKNMFMRQTKLELVNQNADLELEGEITEYRQYNESVAADGFSAKTRLVVTVNVRYVNNANHNNDITDQKFSAFRVYDSNQLLTEVQDAYIEEMVKEITDQIFNATVANW